MGVSTGVAPRPVMTRMTWTRSSMRLSEMTPGMISAWLLVFSCKKVSASATSMKVRSWPAVKLAIMPVAFSRLIVFDQRVMQGVFDGLQGFVRALTVPDGQQRTAAHLHDLAHMREIDVDQAGLGDQFGDALDALAQNVICQAEGGSMGRSCGATCSRRSFGTVIRVSVCSRSLAKPGPGILLPAAHFEREGRGDDRDRNSAQVAGHAGRDRDRPGARAAAHAGGQENHIGASQGLIQVRIAFFSRSFTDARVAAGAQAAGQARAELDLGGGQRALQGLAIGIGSDIFDAGQSQFDHAVNRVTTAAT